MDYQLVISPDLKIKAEEFVATWNQNPQCRDIAKADITEATTASRYGPIDPELVASVFGVAIEKAEEILKNQG